MHGMSYIKFAFILEIPGVRPKYCMYSFGYFPVLSTQYSTPSLWRWNWQRVPKLRQITIWRRGNTKKNTYNIQNTAKVWNQEDRHIVSAMDRVTCSVHVLVCMCLPLSVINHSHCASCLKIKVTNINFLIWRRARMNIYDLCELCGEFSNAKERWTRYFAWTSTFSGRLVDARAVWRGSQLCQFLSGYWHKFFLRLLYSCKYLISALQSSSSA
jgi:hypothetical protein